MFLYLHGKLTPVITDLTRPNGIALSPNEKTLYVSNSDERKRFWMRTTWPPTARFRMAACFTIWQALRNKVFPMG